MPSEVLRERKQRINNMATWRNGSAFGFDCLTVPKGCRFESCGGHNCTFFYYPVRRLWHVTCGLNAFESTRATCLTILLPLCTYIVFQSANVIDYLASTKGLPQWPLPSFPDTRQIHSKYPPPTSATDGFSSNTCKHKRRVEMIPRF